MTGCLETLPVFRRGRRLLLRTALALLLVVAAWVMPPRPAAALDTVDVAIVALSNEGPGHLIDTLIARGHGEDTILQVLRYLKGPGGSAIPASFVSKVAAAPSYNAVFSTRLKQYTGTENALLILDTGQLGEWPLYGKDCAGHAGYRTAIAQGMRYTYALDAAHYIHLWTTNMTINGHTTTYVNSAIAIVWGGARSVYLPRSSR